MSTQKIKTLEELLVIRKGLEATGQKLVLAIGSFDILQVEHVRYLNLARTLGDILFVGIYGDIPIQALKGMSYPVVPEMERAEVIAAMASVDYILIFDESDPKHIIDSLTPDITAKGSEWQLLETASTEVIIEKVLAEFGTIDSEINRGFPSTYTDKKQ
jgi:rfaE bifunctional protein nucleotidyltransferase chain/domain